MKKLICIAVLSLLLLQAAFAQTTAFNFQGRLNDGSSPANGRYDLQFKLFDAITGGNQVGATVDRLDTTVVNGVFSTTLDFGAGAYSPGNRFLEIAVRPAGSPNAYTILGGRQQIMSVPLAVRATSATQADSATNAQNAVNAVVAQNAINASNAATAVTSQNSLSLGGVTASNYARLDTINPGQLVMDGNVRQSVNSNGLVKAMIFVGAGAGIIRCYNGATGQTSGNCGFSIITPAFGVYNINFGFPVDERYVSISVNNGSGGNLRNRGANFRFNGSNLEVFTFNTDDPNNTSISDFMAIVY